MEPAEHLVTSVRPKKSKFRRFPTNCAVCSAPAIYSYVGVIVCPSCKVFFKRNAENKTRHLKCHFNGHCEININTRHVCAYCRLEKCFATGMQTDLLRASTKNSLAIRRARQVNQIQTLSLLRNDRSTLSSEQWTLFSNLIHCYDEHSKIDLAKQYLVNENSLPMKIRFKPDSIAGLMMGLTFGAKSLFERNSDFRQLTYHDQSFLLNSTMTHIAGLAATLIINVMKLYEDPLFYSTVAALYGETCVSDGRRASNLFDPDFIIAKLFLSLMIFSTLNCNDYKNGFSDRLDNINAVIRIQDTYAELVWRYLIYRYDLERAVKCFSNMIRCSFAAIESVSRAVRETQYDTMVECITEKTKDSLGIID